MRRTASSKLSLAVMLGSLAAFVAPYSATAAPVPTLTQASSSSAAALQMSDEDMAFAAGDAVATQGLGALTQKANEDYVRDGQVEGSDGVQYLHYTKTYKGLEVVGADAVVTADGNGDVLDTTAATQAPVALSDTTPSIAGERAVSAARAGFSKVDSAVQEHVVVFLNGSTPTLAWEVSVEGTRDGKPSVQEVYVDAQTGAVLRRDELVKESAEATGTGNHNGKVKFTTTQSGSSYNMISTAAPGLKCGGQSNTPFSDSDNVWGNGSGTDMPTACVDSMYAGEVQGRMLKEWTNRNGIDGKGNFYPARVGLSDVNAYWNGSYANFGRNQKNNKQATPIDVVAHEFGHGLFQFSGGSANGTEAGGMNESTGDIIGAATECYQDNGSVPDKCDYDVGEMVDLVGRGPIRVMSDPSKLNDPNCATQLSGNTEVHAGAGPQNHWFYLLAEGSNPTNGQPKSPICSGGPSVVNGIGIQKATNIFVNGLQRKTSSWSHKSARVATLTAAKALYPSSCTEFNATKDAWAGIAVPAQSGEPTCTISNPTDDYSVSLSPASGSIKAGASATSTLSTQTTAGKAQTVQLSASGLPSGATATFSPTSVSTGSSSTLTIKTTTSTPAGTYPVIVTATGNPIKTASYSLTVGSDGPGPGPGKAPNIDVETAKLHMAKFQSIADANNGNRRAGNSGYTASVDYVVGKLQAAGYTVTKQRCTTSTCSAASDNIIAEYPGGDASKVIMFGAHLDGVTAGPGINDNGSGSAGILEVALTLAAKKPTMLNKVRFAWWTDEEQGLNGSKYYVNNLSSAEKSKIKAYYNFDMIASTNAGYFINNINTAQSAPMKEYWDSLKLAPEENVEGAGRSDDYSFKNAGIPSSGYAMGASARKTASQATKWGGTSGQGYDPCYHARCDTYPSNINTTAFDRAIDGIAYTLWKQAVGGDTPEPDADEYSMSVSPGSASVKAGETATATVNTTVTQGKAQNVALSASGAPSGTTVSFAPTTVKAGASSTMTVKTSASTPAGTYPITISGDGTFDTTTSFSLKVNGGDGEPDADEYSMSVNPSSASVKAGESATGTVKTTVTKGKAQSVALTASGAPNGTTVSFAPTTVQSGASSTMTVKTSASTPAGSYTITINGDGSFDTSTSFTLKVTGDDGPGGGAEFFNGTDYYIYNNYTIASWINSNYNKQVSSATIKYDIYHSCVQDLDIWLVAPDGSFQKVESSSRSRCTKRDGFVTKKVNFSQPVNASGNWRLQISDNGYYNPGTLYSWYLTLP